MQINVSKGLSFSTPFLQNNINKINKNTKREFEVLSKCYEFQTELKLFFKNKKNPKVAHIMKHIVSTVLIVPQVYF